MTKAISLALIAGGVVLLYFGGQAFHSFSSDVSRVFTGSPTNKAIMLIVGGVIATLAGLIGMATSGGKRLSVAATYQNATSGFDAEREPGSGTLLAPWYV